VSKEAVNLAPENPRLRSASGYDASAAARALHTRCDVDEFENPGV